MRAVNNMDLQENEHVERNKNDGFGMGDGKMGLGSLFVGIDKRRGEGRLDHNYVIICIVKIKQ